MMPVNVADFVGEYTESGLERHYKECPVCGSTRNKVYLNTQTGKWFCFEPLHSGGGIVEVDGWNDNFSAEILSLLHESADPVHFWPEMDLPEWKPLSREATEYLVARGMRAGLFKELGLVEMCDTPRVVIPFKGPQGRIIGWTARAYSSVLAHEPKYLNHVGAKPPFVLPNWSSFRSTVLVEGVFDAISVWEATGMPAISIGGVTMSALIEDDVRRLVDKRVYIMLDDDAMASALGLFDRLMDKYTCKVVRVPSGKDPGSMSPRETVEALHDQK